MALLDEIEFRVYRSHIKIPLIFFVPALALLTLYVLIYLYANSNWFVRTLERQLHAAFGGHFEVARLEVEPSLTRVHVHGVRLLTPDREPIIEARTVDASVNPLLLFGNRLHFDHGHVQGADVRLEFDESGTMNLFRGLGFDRREDDDEPDEPGGRALSIGFTNVRLEDSRFQFVDSRFDFTIPDVSIPEAAIHIEPATLLMEVDRLRVPQVDFRFRPEMFGFEEGAGDWEFALRDFELDNWRWANEGFVVERMRGDVEGFTLDVSGRMAFPSSDDGRAHMLYAARGKLTAPYHSPLLHYFTRDNVHFEIPELTAEVRGTLETIDGGFAVHASVVEVAGLFFHDLRAQLKLEDRFLVLEEADASFHGGRVALPYAYFSLLDTRYGAVARFEGVNPRSALEDLDVELHWLDGRASGGFVLVGEVPKSPHYRGERHNAWLEFAHSRYAEMEFTEPLRLERTSRELVPNAVATLEPGARLWVDTERVHIPRARLRLDRDTVDLEDYLFNYQTFELEPTPSGRRARVRAQIADVSRYAAVYGLPELHGALELDGRAHGYILFPELSVRAALERPGWQIGERRLEGTRAELAMTMKDGTLDFERFRFDSNWSEVHFAGAVGLLEGPRGSVRTPEGLAWPTMRRRQPLDLELTVSRGRLAPWSRLIHPELGLRGELEARARVAGTIQQPRGEFALTMNDGEVRGQALPAVAIDGTLDEREVRIERLSVDAARAGTLEATGRYGFDGQMAFALRSERFDLSHVHELSALPVSVEGAGRLHLQGSGTLDAPQIAGGVELYDLGIGERRVGDVALAAHTAGRRLHLTGALLPWLSVSAEVPLGDEGGYYARIGMEGLNLLQAVPELRAVRVLEDVQLTGMFELFLERDFSHHQVLAYLTDVQIESLGQTVRNRGPIIAGVNNAEILQIQQATFGTGGRFVSVQGGVMFDPALLDLRVEGDLDLGLLNTLRTAFPEFFPDVFVESSGYVMLDANLRGAPGNYIADGQMAFGPSELQLRTIPEPIVISSGELRFDRNGITIPNHRPLTGQALGGVVRVVGQMGIVDLVPKTLDIRMWSHNMSYRIPQMANLTFDTDLRLQASDITRLESWHVTGELNVLDGLYYQPINLVEKQLTGRVLGAFSRRAERFDQTIFEQVPGLGDMTFDLAIRARDGFRLRNQIDRIELDLEFRADLRLRNTLTNPRISGDVDVIAGEVSFQGERFEVRSGIVRFTDTLDNPFIDLIAGADIRNTCRESETFDDVSPTMSLSANQDTLRQQYYHITLNVRGDLDNLDILLESNPFADQRDILSMLLTGCTVDQLTASSASRPTLEIALGSLLGRLEREIQDVVKVEEFTILPGVERTQLRIGDTLTRRLSWRFQLDTGFAEATGGQQYQLEYKLSDRWSAELSERSRSETNSFLIDLKLKYRLPLD